MAMLIVVSSGAKKEFFRIPKTHYFNFTCRLATAMLTLLGGFCHPQLIVQLRQAPLIELGPHLHNQLQRWILIHDSSPSPGVEKSLRLIMKAHGLFENANASFVSS